MGWSLSRIAEEIHLHCRAGRLAAHRLARGWTQEDAVRRLEELRPVTGRRRQATTVQMLCAWERGRVSPSLPYLDLLCRLYYTRPDLLGFGADYGADESGPTPGDRAGGAAGLDLRLQQLLAQDNLLPSQDTLEAVRQVRLRSEAMLRQPVVDSDSLTRLEEAAFSYGQAFYQGSTTELLGLLVSDFGEIQEVLQPRQPVSYRRRGTRVAARLGGLAGLSLMAIGHFTEAAAWLRVACLAAERAGDRELRGWVAACQSNLLTWTGELEESLRLAERARALAPVRGPSAAALWASGTRAEALARLGRREQADYALRESEVMFERWGGMLPRDTAFGFREGHLYWIEGKTRTALGDTRRAWTALERSVRDPVPGRVLIRTQIRVDQATCLARDGDVTHACRAAQHVLTDLDPRYRHGPIRVALRGFVAGLPAKYRHLGCVRELDDALGRPD